MRTFKRFFSSALLAFGVGAIANVQAAEQTAVFAGGCFWGVDAVYKHIKGVTNVESGYAGGSAADANYEAVSTGRSGHAEAVRVRFDPAKVSYRQLLQVFFSVAHDPTQLNRQGPDRGTQYRSAIFHVDAAQQKAAGEYIRELTAARTYSSPIVTQVVPLVQFYPAEDYHQNYLALHPYQPYIVIHDMPKLDRLRRDFPALYR
ncbi:MAG: peptide-methionine (S)-S-oxide reductase MsrA [Gammaproteobacteria bacterium]|nr:peptide-methionine (S)-S-oxide reductase MsrA [Gammaproteobacteria bacterium]MBU1777499.1 peptide-methionine (S)-S-oxide reductase MsrA [Gammaproteobacteria bacterium]